MSTLLTQRVELDKAEHDIMDAEHRVGAQALRVARLREHGHQTDVGEKLLASMRDVTVMLRDHRDLILQQIARLEAQDS